MSQIAGIYISRTQVLLGQIKDKFERAADLTGTNLISSQVCLGTE